MLRRTFSSVCISIALSSIAGQALALEVPELALLRETFAISVPEKYQAPLTPEMQAAMDAAIKSYPEVQALTAPEFLVVVNRHPAVQTMSVVLTDGKTVEHIGSSKVSTGNLNRKLYFATPIGIFENKREFGNYRAEGTKNENGVRGLGKKGMRVYDFGWHDSVASWGKREKASIRLQMHATDPDQLEQRLGTTASKGCVRIQTGVNAFIDQYGVLDKNYTASATDAAGWVLSKHKRMDKYDGRYMVVMEQAPAAVVPVATNAPQTAPVVAPASAPIAQ